LNGARVIGFAARQAPRLFPCAVRCAFRPAVPLSELSGSFPRARDASEFLRSHSRPFPFGIRLSARVSSLFATSPGASTRLEGFPSPRYVPSAGVLNLSTAFSALRLRGLVSSRSRLQGRSARSGACHLRAVAAFLIGSVLPPCRCSPAALQNKSGVHDPAPSTSRP